MQINKSDLQPALESVCQIASKRTTIPVLNCVRIEAVNNLLTIRASDLDQEEISTVACVGDLPATCVSARILFELARSSGPSITMAMKGEKLLIESAGKASIACLPVDQFPEPISDKFASIGVNSEGLADGIESVAWAQSDDQSRYVLNAVHVVTSESEIMCQASNGRQLAQFIRKSIASQSELLIGSAFVSRLCAVLRKAGATIKLGERYISVEHESGAYFCKVMDSKFPNIAPMTSAKRVDIGEVPREELLNPLLICDSLANDSALQPGVSLKFNGSATVELSNNRDNQYTQTIEGRFNEAEMSCGLHSLIDCLKSFKSDTVKIQRGEDNYGPVIFTSGDLMAMSSQMRVA